MHYTSEDEKRLAAELEICNPAAAEHLRYHDWLDAYASRVIASFGVPLPRYGEYPHPDDYAIDWPREIRLGITDREWIFKVWFADRLVCVVKPAPPYQPRRRLRRLLITVAEHAMHYPEQWTSS